MTRPGSIGAAEPRPIDEPMAQRKAPARSGVRTLSEIERAHILEVLEQTGGDRTLTATLLGIGRTTLYRKLKEYGLTAKTEGAEPGRAGLTDTIPA